MALEEKSVEMLSVNINGEEFKLSSGRYNKLKRDIIEKFAPRCAPGHEFLYVKDLIKDADKLRQLGFETAPDDKMPDVILYRPDNDWIYYIEAVTNDRAMSPQRMVEIQNMTQNVTSGEIFVSAFPDKDTCMKFILDLARETVIWISEAPYPMIYLDGDQNSEQRH